ncbi:hypothetical protein N0V90_008358 [Kalmusia sp. IMI 367209]|nr:hypothetical protein N0V90_008358 [Kalmusia sp. IMI 367209]
MQEHERFGQEQKNILALREWNGSNSLSGLVEHIQALSDPLHELPSLLDFGGRFIPLVDSFSKWFSWVDEVWSERNGSGGRGSAMRSIEGLGDAWRGENMRQWLLMQAMEAEIVAKEQRWVEERLRYIARDTEKHVEIGDEAWRMY